MNAFTAALKLIDPFVIALTGLFSYYLRFDDLELPANYRTVILVVFALTIVVFVTTDVYRWRPDEGLRRGLARLVGGWFGIMLALVLLLYATKTGSDFSRQWLGVWGALAFLSLILVRIEQVWIALPLRAGDRVARLLQDLVSLNVKVRFVPDIFGFQLLNHSFTEICGLPVVNISESPFSGLKGALKWVEDKALALIILALISPLLVVIALGIKLGSPGPVIFRQRRGGLDNREIIVWKFRTMTVHDEAKIGEVPQARKNDPRVTPFGAFLRRTSMDELPQFINVLTGDMSVVGPRPHPLWLNDFHRDKIPRYMLRSWIKPGITGWAQVCGWRGETDEPWKMEMRVQHDLYYIENWSLGFDLYIILLTLFRLRSAHAY